MTCGCTSDTAQCISLRSCIGTRTAARPMSIFSQNHICVNRRDVANTNTNTNTNLARHPLAALLVRLISTVEVAVALFLLRDEQTVLPPVDFALVVLIFEHIGQVCCRSIISSAIYLVVLLPIVAVLFVAFVVAVNFLVTPYNNILQHYCLSFQQYFIFLISESLF